MFNPDLEALVVLEEVLKNMTIEYSDGVTEPFDRIDVGFTRTPTGYPYASLRTGNSDAPIKSLGRGGGIEARSYSVDCIIILEYEHPEGREGYERLTCIKWQTFLKLLEAQPQLEKLGVTMADFDTATLDDVFIDSGEFADWGYTGQVLIPITLTFSPYYVAGKLNKL